MRPGLLVIGLSLAANRQNAELLRANGHYAALWQRQSGGFIDVEEMRAAE